MFWLLTFNLFYFSACHRSHHQHQNSSRVTSGSQVCADVHRSSSRTSQANLEEIPLSRFHLWTVTGYAVLCMGRVSLPNLHPLSNRAQPCGTGATLWRMKELSLKTSLSKIIRIMPQITLPTLQGNKCSHRWSWDGGIFICIHRRLQQGHGCGSQGVPAPGQKASD